MAQSIAYSSARKKSNFSIEYRTPLNLPNWDFKSLITNLGVTASITVPAFTLLGELAKARDNEFLRWSLVAGVLIWFAPLVFLVWRGNSAGPGMAPAYFGYAFFYLVYAVFATAGLASQLAVLGHMLGRDSKVDQTSGQAVAGVTLVAALLVLVYGGRTSYLILLAAAPTKTNPIGVAASIRAASAEARAWSLL